MHVVLQRMLFSEWHFAYLLALLKHNTDNHVRIYASAHDLITIKSIQPCLKLVEAVFLFQEDLLVSCLGCPEIR